MKQDTLPIMVDPGDQALQLLHELSDVVLMKKILLSVEGQLQTDKGRSLVTQNLSVFQMEVERYLIALSAI